jgi:HSP20 family molecular chaperone IbpA
MDKAAATREPEKVKVAYGEGLGELERAIQRAIADQAYEFYLRRGRSHGHDLEDWFHAEQELIKPADIHITDAGGQLIVQAKVPGFQAGQIAVGVAARKVIIWGLAARQEPSTLGSQMLGEIDLPSAVKAEKSVATLKGETIEVRAYKETSGASGSPGSRT